MIKTQKHKIIFYINILIFSAILNLVTSCRTTQNNSDTNNNLSRKTNLTQLEEIQLTALFIDANKEKHLGNYDKALGLFSQCIKRKSDYSPAIYEMAVIHAGERRYNEAIPLAKEACKIEEKNKWYKLLLANLYLDIREYLKAGEVYYTLYNLYPENISYLENVAQAYSLAGKYKDAIKIYDKIEKEIGITEEISIAKEYLYFRIGKSNKAVGELTKLAEAYPKETKYLGLLADLYLNNRYYSKAYEFYQKMLIINPDDPLVHISLYNYYVITGDSIKCFQELETAFKSNSLDIDTKIEVLLQYFEITESKPEYKEQSFRLLKILTEVNPDYAKTWSIYGDFLYRENLLIEARDAFRKVLLLDSTRYVVWEQLFAIEIKLEDYISLKNEAARAIEIFSDQPITYLYCGYGYLKENQYQQAIEMFKLALSFSTGENMMCQIYYNLGEAYYKKGMIDDSFESFEKAIKKCPEKDYIINQYCFYLALQKRNLSRGRNLAVKLNETSPNNAVYEDTYAWILFALEEYEEALKWAEKAIIHDDKDNITIIEHYGDILFKTGNTDKAVEYWQKAVDMGADSELLLQKIKNRTWYEKL